MTTAFPRPSRVVVPALCALVLLCAPAVARPQADATPPWGASGERPFAPGAPRPTTIAPRTPTTALWMCAAVAGSVMLATESS